MTPTDGKRSSLLSILQVEPNWIQVSSVLFVPHTEEEYDQLVGTLDELLDIVGEDESHPLASLMDVVGALVEQ